MALTQQLISPQIFIYCISVCCSLAAETTPNIAPFGDFTLRYENDHNAENTQQSTRERIRFILHAGLDWEVNESNEIRLRARTGDLDNHLVPAITLHRFDDNSLGNRGAYLDQWYWKHDAKGLKLVLGRFLWPFWSTTGYFWDLDATTTGINLAKSWGPHSAQVILITPPDGALDYHSRLSGVQYLWRSKEQPKLKASLSLVAYEGKAGADHLKNADLDYWITEASLEWQALLAKRPLKLGFDIYTNLQSYNFAARDPRSRFADDRSGFGIKLSWGENKNRGDWRFRYNYSYSEKFALMSDYAQNTLTRFANTDRKAHDFRVIYTFVKGWNAMFRLSLSEGIREDWSADRFRFDISHKF